MSAKAPSLARCRAAPTRREFIRAGAGLVAAALPFEVQAAAPIDLGALGSPILLQGDARTAFRDPAVVFEGGVFHLFFTWIRHDAEGPWWTLGVSRSRDLVEWSAPRALTPKDRRLNFCAPGNAVRFEGSWVLCLQTYPTPHGEKYGNDDARIWTMRSRDLETWGEPELLRVRGPGVPVGEMGRMIDPYLLEDRDEPGKWWCFFDTNAANTSWSRDLETWTYAGQTEAGENVCVLVDGDEYLMFHSPRNGVALKRSRDLRTWRDVGVPVTLGQAAWPWARGRLTAGFVMDLRDDPRIGRYLMFFHGTGPEDESVVFSTHASLGLAWSDDLTRWSWPGQSRGATAG